MKSLLFTTSHLYAISKFDNQRLLVVTGGGFLVCLNFKVNILKLAAIRISEFLLFNFQQQQKIFEVYINVEQT